MSSPSTMREPAAVDETERVDDRLPVERRGDRRPPVDDHRIVRRRPRCAADRCTTDRACSSGDPPEEVAGPGLRRSSSASATVTSTYSAVISSAERDGIDLPETARSSRRGTAGESQVVALSGEFGEQVGMHGVGDSICDRPTGP